MTDWRIPADERAVARYFATTPPPVRATALALDAVVRAEIAGVSVGMKWGVPFYTRKWPVCYISVSQKHVTFGLLHGQRVPDRSGLLTGTGRSPIRSARFRPGDPIPKAAVRAWLKASRRFDDAWGQDLPDAPAKAPRRPAPFKRSVKVHSSMATKKSAKGSAAKKPAAKKAPAKKALAKNAAAKVPARKTPAKKAPAKPARAPPARASAGEPDWRAATLARVRRLIQGAVPDVVEEQKWVKPSNPAGVPTWSHQGIICTGETYKDRVKLTFAKGAMLPDPARLFNASLEGATRRAIDIRENDTIDESAFKALVREAAALNASAARRR